MRKGDKIAGILVNFLTEMCERLVSSLKYNTKTRGKQRRTLAEPRISVENQLFLTRYDCILNNGNEGVRLETGTSDQCAIDVRLR